MNSGGVPISVDWIDWKAEDDCGAKIFTYISWCPAWVGTCTAP